jgi:hypothetical protein
MRKLLIVACFAVAACTGGAKDKLTLSARLGAPTGQALATANGAAEVASGIDVTGVRIVIRRLRLEREDDKTEMKISEGPLLLKVDGSNLGGALIQLVTASVPAGTYDKLKLDIHVIDSAPSPDFKDLVDRGVSVLIEGTVDTKPFTFAAALEAELEHEGRFQLGGPANNITLNVDASKWFTAADGSRLSPADPTAREAILANIRASFSAFEDDDEDGEQDDDHRDGGKDEGEHHDGGDDHRDGGEEHHDGG